MSTKDLALRIVKDHFGVLAEEICRYVSNKGHPSFPEIVKNANGVFNTKVNDTKISECVLSLSLHGILVPMITELECKKYNAKAALFRLRLGSFIQYVKDEYGEECANIAIEFSIRGSATIDDVITSVLHSYSNTYTTQSLTRAIDVLIMRNLLSQKTDIATYARDQNAEFTVDDISRRPPPSRGRGRGRGRGSRGGRGRGGRDTNSYGGRSPMQVDGEKEWDDGTSRKRIQSLGDQIMEMQVKKQKMDMDMKEGVAGDVISTLDKERKLMLFTLNMDQYTCIMRQNIILDYVSKRINTVAADVLRVIFSVIGYSRRINMSTSGMFSGQQVYARLDATDKMTWSVFLRHMMALASNRITPCTSTMDAMGGEYKMDYENVMNRIVEDTVSSFINVCDFCHLDK